jgi:phosphate transport system substrate-binding protein
MANKMIKNNEAVSPIVATLILIIVAIVAAAAVMTFMNSYNSKVSTTAIDQTDKIVDQMTATQTPTTLSGSVVVSGSTTLQPTMMALAAAFHAANPGVQVNAGIGGGSGKGEGDIANHAVDIGMSSKTTTSTTWKAANPSATVEQVGARGIVFVVGQGQTSSSHVNATLTQLKALFDASSPIAIKPTGVSNNIAGVAVRTESSGTADDASTYLFGDKTTIYTTKAGKTGYTGNAGVYNAVKAGMAASPVIGFVDWGYVNSADPVQLVDIYNDTASTPYTVIPSKTTIVSEINIVLGRTNVTAGTPPYEAGLVSGLYIMYNAPVSSATQAFINFVEAPAQGSIYTANGIWSMSDL